MTYVYFIAGKIRTVITLREGVECVCCWDSITLPSVYPLKQTRTNPFLRREEEGEIVVEIFIVREGKSIARM